MTDAEIVREALDIYIIEGPDQPQRESVLASFSRLESQASLVGELREWANDAGWRESGIDDGDEVDTYEDGYEAAQDWVLHLLASLPKEADHG